MTTISVIPRSTEKAYALGAKNNVYVFNVPLTANKQAIAASVETQFNVKVTGIKTLVQNGKTVRFSRGKNRYPGKTTRKNAKKAYVTLAEGSSIQFDSQTEEEKK